MKVVIIGLGSIAKKHIFALGKLKSNVDIFALRHKNPANNIRGIKNIYSIQDIESIKPKFILISNPTALHYQTIVELVDLEIPLFIEKPLFSTVGNKEKKLVDDISERNIPNYIGCNLRFHKGLIKLKQLVKSDQIEEVNIYCGSYLPDWRPGVDFRTVYSANKEMGGGVHIDLIHELDYIYWFFGNPREVHKIFKSNSSLNISSVDYANYVFDYNKFCSNIILNYYRKDAKRTCEIITTKGTFNLNILDNRITFNNEEIYYEKQEVIEMYINQMKYFLEEVITKKNKFNTIDEAYKILELCY